MIAIILRFLAGGLFRALWKPVAALLGFAATYFKGRADARQSAKIEAQADTIDAHETRGRIEDDIDQDSNLIDRAVKSGLVRRDGH